MQYRLAVAIARHVTGMVIIQCNNIPANTVEDKVHKSFPCAALRYPESIPPAPNPRKKTTGATPLCNKIPDIGAQHPRRLRERPRDVVFNTCYRCYLVLVGLFPRPSRSIIVTSLLVKVRSGTNGTAGGYRLDYVTIKGLRRKYEASELSNYRFRQT